MSVSVKPRRANREVMSLLGVADPSLKGFLAALYEGNSELMQRCKRLESDLRERSEYSQTLTSQGESREFTPLDENFIAPAIVPEQIPEAEIFPFTDQPELPQPHDDAKLLGLEAQVTQLDGKVGDVVEELRARTVGEALQSQQRAKELEQRVESRFQSFIEQVKLASAQSTEQRERFEIIAVKEAIKSERERCLAFEANIERRMQALTEECRAASGIGTHVAGLTKSFEGLEQQLRNALNVEKMHREALEAKVQGQDEAIVKISQLVHCACGNIEGLILAIQKAHDPEELARMEIQLRERSRQESLEPANTTFADVNSRASTGSPLALQRPQLAIEAVGGSEAEVLFVANTRSPSAQPPRAATQPLAIEDVRDKPSPKSTCNNTAWMVLALAVAGVGALGYLGYMGHINRSLAFLRTKIL